MESTGRRVTRLHPEPQMLSTVTVKRRIGKQIPSKDIWARWKKIVETAKVPSRRRTRYGRVVQQPSRFRSIATGKATESASDANCTVGNDTKSAAEVSNKPGEHTESAAEAISSKATEFAAEANNTAGKATESVVEVNSTVGRDTMSAAEVNIKPRKHTESVAEINDTAGKVAESVFEVNNTSNKVTESVVEVNDTASKVTESVVEVNNTAGKDTKSAEVNNTADKDTKSAEVNNTAGKVTESSAEANNTAGKGAKFAAEINNTAGKVAESAEEVNSTVGRDIMSAAEVHIKPRKHTESIAEIIDTAGKDTKSAAEVNNTASKVTESSAEANNTAGMDTKSAEVNNEPGEHTESASEANSKPGEHTESVSKVNNKPGEHTVSPAEANTKPGEHTVSSAEVNNKPGEHTVSSAEVNNKPGEHTVSSAEVNNKPGEHTVSLAEANNKLGEHTVSSAEVDNTPGKDTESTNDSLPPVPDERTAGKPVPKTRVVTQSLSDEQTASKSVTLRSRTRRTGAKTKRTAGKKRRCRMNGSAKEKEEEAGEATKVEVAVVKLHDCETDSGGDFNSNVSPSQSKTALSCGDDGGSTSSGVSTLLRPKSEEDEECFVQRKEGATISSATKEEMIRECAKALEGYSDDDEVVEAQLPCLIAAEEQVDTLPIALEFSRLCEEYAQNEEQVPSPLGLDFDGIVVMDTAADKDALLGLTARATQDSDRDFCSTSPCTSFLSSEENSALSDCEGEGSSSEEQERERNSLSSEPDFDEDGEEHFALEDTTKDNGLYKSDDDSDLDKMDERVLSLESDRDTSDTDSYRESEEDRSSISSFIQPPEEDSYAVDDQCAVENVAQEEVIEVADPLNETPCDSVNEDAVRALMLEQVKKHCDKCVYCNHAKRIAVIGQQLLGHLQEEHGVELPYTVADTHVGLWDGDERQYECFRCIKKFALHSELCVHMRKTHQNSALCIICKCSFRSYSELVCHRCSGVYRPEDTNLASYRCCLCAAGPLSAFRLLVHLRCRHVTCDVCLQEAMDQEDLAKHMRIHKLPHLCHHCGIAYRNKHDMKKHMFWKHGTESVLCKRCLQRKWPHQYHFCVPPASFRCDKCEQSFSRAVALRVHTRIHDLQYPHSCKECGEQFISKKLLAKHQSSHQQDNLAILPADTPPTENCQVVKEDVTPSISADETNASPAPASNRFEISNIPALNLSSEGEDSDSEDELLLKPLENSQSCDDSLMSIGGSFNAIMDNIHSMESFIMKEHDYCVVSVDIRSDVPGPDGDKRSSASSPAKSCRPRKRRKVGHKAVERLTSSSSGRSSSSSSSDSSSSSSTSTCGSCCSCSPCGDSDSHDDDTSSSDCESASAEKDVSPPIAEQKRTVPHGGGGDGEDEEERSDKAYEIRESDLETEERESDCEEFYEEHPELAETVRLVTNSPRVEVKKETTLGRKRHMDTEPAEAAASRRYSKRSRVSKKFSDEWCGVDEMEHKMKAPELVLQPSRKRSSSGKVSSGRKRPRIERLYCYCRKAHDPDSRMIGCDGKNCKLEWFHFDCVNILIAPKGKWYCPDCRPGAS